MNFSNPNEFLHALRTRELRKMPGGASVFLSAGCSGRWYFDWINENYPGIRRHLGVEAYSPRPVDLPSEAVWLTNHIYDMRSVASNDVDLVFAGQTIEHLWPNELSGFLGEAHRVLKPGGAIVLDSPNQPITKALNWHQPEHTMELSVQEIRELVTLAGFRDIAVRGIWLCYDRGKNALLPLVPDLSRIDIESDRRVVLASELPEDCFIWWLEARKDAARLPDIDEMAILSQSIYDREYRRALQRVFTQVGQFQNKGKRRIIRPISISSIDFIRGFLSNIMRDLRDIIREMFISFRTRLQQCLSVYRSNVSKSGYLRHGPYMPLKAGSYLVRFWIGVPWSILNTYHDTDMVVAKLDVCADNGTKVLARKDVMVVDLQTPRNIPFTIKNWVMLGRRDYVPQDLTFDIKDVTFGVEFRVFKPEEVYIKVKADVELINLSDK